MNFIHILLTVLAIFAGLALFFGLFVMRNMFIPTRGRRIVAYSHPTKALLVMDIQESSGNSNRQPVPLSSATPLGAMIIATNRAIDWFAQAGMEVAYVRQVFENNWITRLHGGRIVAGRLEPQIDRRVRIINRNDFKKNRTDAFSNPGLERLLISRQVDEVYLVGLDAAFCVYYTALGALYRGYRVTVVKDAVLTGRDMTRVLARYRRKGIRVIDSNELANQLS